MPNSYPIFFSLWLYLGLKVEDSDLAHFLEDGTKLKITSENQPPLKEIMSLGTVEKCDKVQTLN